MEEERTEGREKRPPWRCSEAFEFMHTCNSLRMQMKAIYRTGEVQQCGHFSKEFWACVRARFSNPDKAWEKYEEFQKQKKAAEQAHVWELRESPPPLFAKDTQTE